MHSKVTVLDGVPSLAVVVHEGDIYQAVAGFHPNFDAIFTALEANPTDVSVLPLFDIEKTLNTALSKILSERVSVRHGEVLFDGDPLHNGVAKQILRFVEEGEMDRLEAVVAFTEKVMTNPQEHSRDQLFTWLDRHDFTITENGDFVGYKGCSPSPEGPRSTRVAPEKDGVLRNGQPVVGEAVLNLEGDVIEMPRSKVDFNAYVGCSTGLHVGTYGYAKSFAAELLEVHVNPRDVVSVPTDCNAQKIRTCRYTVIGPVEDEYKTAVLPKAQVAPSDEVDDEFEDDVIRVGDSVRTVKDVVKAGGYNGTDAYVPLGSHATVLAINPYGIRVAWEDKSNGSDGEWIPDRFKKVTAAQKAWDTRNNHTKQKRYPKGHPKAGQFVPKGQ